MMKSWFGVKESLRLAGISLVCYSTWSGKKIGGCRANESQAAGR